MLEPDPMNNITQEDVDEAIHYRVTQLNKIETDPISEYLVKLCFIDPTGSQTNYIDITNEEFDQIREILTGKGAE